MSSNDLNKKYKKPKCNTSNTTNPSRTTVKEDKKIKGQTKCALLAKDSEWVDKTLHPQSSTSASCSNSTNDEEILQLVECEEGPEMKPLAIMFPDLLAKDPQTLQGVYNKAMSTTDVTRHLVNLHKKADFTFMKKANRLIPKDKEWLERVSEASSSISSSAGSCIIPELFNADLNENNKKEDESDIETRNEKDEKCKRKTKPILFKNASPLSLTEESDNDENKFVTTAASEEKRMFKVLHLPTAPSINNNGRH